MASNIKVIQPGAQPFASDINQVAQALNGQADLDLPNLATQVNAPGAPTVVVGSSGPLTGAYKYQIVYVTGWIDSYYNMYVAGFVPSAETSITLTAQNGNVTIPSFNLPIIGALIYRTAAGGATGTEKYVGMVMQNTGLTFIDSVLDANLGNPPSSGVFNNTIPASVPTTNTTGTTLQLGSSANSFNGNAVMSLLVPQGNGVGLDNLGNLKVVNPSTVVANNSWNVFDKNNAAILTVLLDGTKVVKTSNNTLDNGSGNATIVGTLGVTGALTGSSTIQGTRFISTIAVGTAPFSVTSTTVVTNLNSDLLDGQHGSYYAPIASPALTGTPTAPTAAVSTNTTQLATTAFVLGQVATATPTMNGTGAVGTSLLFARQDHVHPTDTSRAPLASPTFTGTATAPSFASTVATGTAPFSVTSTTVVTNLNADMTDGYHMNQDVQTTASPTHVRLTLSQATGTSPFSITSTTVNTNLNADMTDGYHFNQSLLTTDSPTFAGLTVAGQGVVLANASCNKNWGYNGQSGQPSWLWGSNDGINCAVWNPSNFNVNSANYLGGNSYSQGWVGNAIMQRNSSGGINCLAVTSAWSTGSTTITNNSGPTWTHNLGYVPIVNCVGTAGNVNLTVNATTTTVTVFNYNAGSNSWTGNVYLF